MIVPAAVFALVLSVPTGGSQPLEGIDSVNTMANKIEGLIELDNHLTTITARLDEIEFLQDQTKMESGGYVWNQDNTMHRPTLRDRRRAFRRAREDIVAAMVDTYPNPAPGPP